MVKAQAGVLEWPPDQAAAKLRTSIAGVIPDTAEAGSIESHLRPLAGLGAADPGRGDGETSPSPPGVASSSGWRTSIRWR